ncbi:MAG: methyltransferase domain-containing protein [Bradymonadales bacterium]|nr:methyltransferase domain-containing protein [Bradymonadales bacterium]
MADGALARLDSYRWAFASHRVLTVAARTGIFSRLAKAPASLEELAAALGIDPFATAKIVRALCAMGLVTAHGKEYALEAELVEWFQGDERDQVAGLEHSHDLYDGWGATIEGWVRTGTMPPRKRSAEGVERFAAAMRAGAARHAPEVARALDLRAVRRALDIGGGTGAYAVHLCRQNADLHAVVLDLPPVVALGPANVAGSGVGGRISFVAGDFHQPNFGAGIELSGFDLALLCSIIHQERPDGAQALIHCAAGSLAPGGRLAIVDFSIDDEQREVLSSCLFAINMRSFGDTYPEPVIRGWMAAAGLSDIARTDFGPSRWMFAGTKIA